MRRVARITVALGLLAVGLDGGAGLAAEPAPGAPTASERAAALVGHYKRDLQQALGEGLAEGPAEAIDACRLRAPAIADALSRDGVRVGRSSHRLRNPENAPPDWVAPLLAAYVAGIATPEPQSLPLEGGRTGYVEPIFVQPPCLTCHGEVLDPEVAAAIAEAYPNDRAVGFAVGDFRGVFWVELPATP